MNPDATGFDDPQPAGEFMLFQPIEQLTEEDFKQSGRHASGGREHGNPCRFIRREAQHLGEIRIQGNQGAAFGGTDSEDRRVG